MEMILTILILSSWPFVGFYTYKYFVNKTRELSIFDVPFGIISCLTGYLELLISPIVYLIWGER
jgi:hypothetical protein